MIFPRDSSFDKLTSRSARHGMSKCEKALYWLMSLDLLGYCESKYAMLCEQEFFR